MFKKAKENKKGFTLAELLIVVAIIAVLVAISIPIFTSQLEKSREAVDAANIRAAYAEASAEMLTTDASTKAWVVTAKQTKDKWGKEDNISIGGQTVSVAYTGGTNKVWRITIDNTNNKVVIAPAEAKVTGDIEVGK